MEAKSSSHVSFKRLRGVFVRSLNTNSSTVRRFFGAGWNSFRFTCTVQAR